MIVGAGGLGSPAAIYLAGMGIGEIGIIDNDKVQISNIHRQILFDETDIKKNKAKIAKTKLKNIQTKIYKIHYILKLIHYKNKLINSKHNDKHL